MITSAARGSSASGVDALGTCATGSAATGSEKPGSIARATASRLKEGAQGERAFGWLDISRTFAIAAIFVLFALSVWVRLGHLDDPMGLHHEEGTARTLVHSAIWWEEGPNAGGFLLRSNFGAPGDKYLSGGGPLADDDGNTYYASLPPGHPLWMFLAHRAVGLEPSVASVRYLNLGVNLLSAALIYLIVREMLRGLPDGWSRASGLMGVATYLFAPVVLWFQSNAWTSASAVQPFFIAAIWAVLRTYRAEEKRRWWLAGVGALVFLMSYTEWLGPAFALVLAGLWLMRRRSDPAIGPVAAVAAAGSAGALALTFLQYSTIAGAASMADFWTGRYQLRSGFGGSSVARWSNPASWMRLLGQYIDSLAPQAVLLALLFAWDRALAWGKRGKFRAGGPVGTTLVLAIAPVLVHHVVLFDHAVIHDFDMLKTSVFVALVGALLAARLIARYSQKTEGARNVAVGAALVLVLAMGYVSVRLYEWLNPTYLAYQRIGTAISQTVEPDEVVFLVSFDYMPVSVLSHYSGRTWVPWPGEEQAPAVLARGSEGRTGVVFGADLGRGVFETWYVAEDGSLHATRAEAKAAGEGAGS